MRKDFTLILLFFFVLIACEESIDKSIRNSNTSTLIVEGILTNEKKNHLIRLSQSYATQNSTSPPVSGALVRVSDGATVYLVNETPVGSGNYLTESFLAVTGRTYALYIQYQGREYGAHDSSVPVDPLQPLSLKKVNDRFQLNFQNSGKSANFIDHNIDWKSSGACQAGQQCEGKVVFYDLKNVDVNDLFKPSKAELTFPVNTTITRRKYSCSLTFQFFLRSMLSETEWRGGVFDVQRDNTATNLSGGAMGFFAVTSVVEDISVVKP